MIWRPPYLKEFSPFFPQMYEAEELIHKWNFQDQSWHNDAAPRFVSPDRAINIWIEHPDPKLREIPHRFCIDRVDIVDGEEVLTGEVVLVTDSWSDITDFLKKNYSLDLSGRDAQGRVSFQHQEMDIVAPHVSECGRCNLDPSYYGFAVWDTGGGCTAWGRNFGEYQMLVTQLEDPSADLAESQWKVTVGVYKTGEGEEVLTYSLDAAGDVIPNTYRRSKQ